MGITLSSVGGNRSEKKEKQRAGEIVKPRLVNKGHDDSGRGCCRHGHARTQISSASSPALSPTISHQMQRFLASSDQAFPVTYPKDGQTSSQSFPRGSTGNRTKEVPHFPAPSAPLHILPKNSSSHGDSGTPVKQSTPGKIIQRTPRRKSPEPTVPSHVVPRTPARRSQSISPKKVKQKKVETPSKERNWFPLMRALQRQRSVDSLLSPSSKRRHGQVQATVPSHRVAPHRKSWQTKSPSKISQSTPQTPRDSPYKRSLKPEPRLKRQNTAHYLFPSEIGVLNNVSEFSVPNKQPLDSIPQELRTFKSEATKQFSHSRQNTPRDIPNKDLLVKSPKNPKIIVSNLETGESRTNVQNLFEQASENWESPVRAAEMPPTRKAQSKMQNKTPSRKKKQVSEETNNIGVGAPAFKVEIPSTPASREGNTSAPQSSQGSVNIDANGVRIQKAETNFSNGSPYTVPFQSLVNIKENGSLPTRVFQNGNLRVTISQSKNKEEKEVEYNPMTGQKLVSERNGILSKSKHFNDGGVKSQKLSKISQKKRSSLIDDPETNPMDPIVRFESPIMDSKVSREKRTGSLIDNPETNPMRPIAATSSPGVLLAVEDTLHNIYQQVTFWFRVEIQNSHQVDKTINESKLPATRNQEFSYPIKVSPMDTKASKLRKQSSLDRLKSSRRRSSIQLDDLKIFPGQSHSLGHHTIPRQRLRGDSPVEWLP